MYSKHQFKSKQIGIIATEDIVKDSFIGIYFSKNIPPIMDCVEIYKGWVEKYPLGRYINHSFNPNLRVLLKEDKIELFSKVDILRHQELTLDYLEIKNLLNIPDYIISEKDIFKYNDTHTFSNLNYSLI